MGIRPDLASAAAALPQPPLTRFAPSPTGYLHLGHVVNAIYVWGIAQMLGGGVLLRIEDHDRIRCRADYDAALREDLDWLGFVPTVQPVGPLSQRERGPVYEDALAHLRSTCHVYACDCSRKAIGGERYSGRCRARGLDVRPGRGIRVEMAPGTERFDDLLLGAQEQTPADQCGDLLLKDRDGHWTYQLAATADDVAQGVTLVIRGSDLLSSTGRQIRLAHMLGRLAPPRFLHHPLVVTPSGEKLSKSNRDIGVREMRHSGLSAPEVIGRAAAAVGLTDRVHSIPASLVHELFAHAGPDPAAPADDLSGIESEAV